MTDQELRNMWLVLREIKDDFKHFDDKWEEHIKSTAEDRAVLKRLSQQVDSIEKLLIRGNGQKSVMVQLEGLHNDVTALKVDHKALKAANGIEDRSPEEAKAQARRAKYAAVAKIAGLLTLALPGILSLLGVRG